MKQLAYTMLFNNNHTSLEKGWNEYLVKHQKDSNYYENDCKLICLTSLYSGPLTLKRVEVGSIWLLLPTLPYGFSKNVYSRERMKPWSLVTFNFIASYIFPENLIEIPEIFQKIWIFSPPILTIFINFLDFLTFLCYKETNGVSI